MSSKPWYPFYPFDYAGKTRHLSTLEHGIYLLWLNHYYCTRQALPNDPVRLAQIASITSDVFQSLGHSLLQSLFYLKDSHWHNKRADLEIEKLQKAYKSRSEWAKGLKKPVTKTVIGTVTAIESESQPDLQLQPQSTKPTAASDNINGEIVEFIPLTAGQQWGVPKTYLAELERAYPAVDGPGTLREIRAWCVSNPAQCKTRRGVTRFINRWFERVQNGPQKG